MRIGIDIRSLVEPFPSGISEYTAQVIKHLLARDQESEYLLFYNAAKHLPLECVEQLRASNTSIIDRRIPSKLFNAGQTFLNYPHIDSLLGGVDVFFEPSFLSFASFSRRCRVVIVVHDISFKYHGFYSTKGYWWHRFIRPKRMLDRAETIIAVSESTRRDIISLYGIPAERVVVIPLGVDQSRLEKKDPLEIDRVQKKYKLPTKFFLYLGTVEQRKNVRGLLKAWKRLEQTKQDSYELVIAGRITDSKLKRSSSSVTFLGYVPDGDKPALYQSASVFVYPSYFEGFGIPVAEAMASGLPVITSHATSLPSVAKNAALLIDPYSTEDLATAMGSLMSDEELRIHLGTEAKRASKEFTWDATAAKTLSLLQTNAV